MYVVLVNSDTREKRSLKIGWSWTIFLFTEFFCIPLFTRRLYGWAILIIAVGGLPGLIVVLLSPYSPLALIGAPIIIISLLLVNVAWIYLCIKGNGLAGKKYLREGWEFYPPDSAEVQQARLQWGLID